MRDCSVPPCGVGPRLKKPRRMFTWEPSILKF